MNTETRLSIFRDHRGSVAAIIIFIIGKAAYDYPCNRCIAYSSRVHVANVIISRCCFHADISHLTGETAAGRLRNATWRVE